MLALRPTLAAATCVLAAAVPGAAQASATTEAHHGAAALAWLTNPAHAKAGTARSRARAYARASARLYRALRQAGWLAGALCIHHYEGSWQDPGAPYYGGLQMDYGFQQAYGLLYLRRWGTADHWPVWAQLHTAYTAWLTRGWAPWPATSRMCGLR